MAEEKMSRLYALVDLAKSRSKTIDDVRVDVQNANLNKVEKAVCLEIFEHMVANHADGSARTSFDREYARNLAQRLGSLGSMHRVAHILTTAVRGNKYIDGGYLRVLHHVWDDAFGWRR